MNITILWVYIKKNIKYITKTKNSSLILTFFIITVCFSLISLWFFFLNLYADYFSISNNYYNNDIYFYSLINSLTLNSFKIPKNLEHNNSTNLNLNYITGICDGSFFKS